MRSTFRTTLPFSICLVAAGLALSSPGRAEEEPRPPSLAGAPIRYFQEVVPGRIYRSGQPGEEGFRWLKVHGLRSVVCLREEHDDGSRAMEALGLHYLYLPIRDNHAPSRAQAETFLKFAADPENWPVLVHCHHGEGRAPTMAALLRYSFDGKSMSESISQGRHSRLGGLIRTGFHHPQERFLREWAEAHVGGALRPQGWLALAPAQR
jgi:protein tyrosine phosphatase (PTP) superfamily phosphohydrolase (DUF442 family)